MARTIIRRQEGEWSGLSYNNDHWYKDGSPELLPLGTPTADEYADLCDSEAENANHHDFCGVHKALLALLRNEMVDEGKVVGVMRAIAERGGFMDMG